MSSFAITHPGVNRSRFAGAARLNSSVSAAYVEIGKGEMND